MADILPQREEQSSQEIINLVVDESRGTGPQAEDFIKTWGSGDVDCVELGTTMRKDVLRSITLLSKDGVRHELPVKLLWNSFRDIRLGGSLDSPTRLKFKTAGGETREITPRTDLKKLKEIFGSMVVGMKKLDKDFDVDIKQVAYEAP